MSANKPPLGDDEGVDRFYPSGHEDKLLVRRIQQLLAENEALKQALEEALSDEMRRTRSKLVTELDRQQREDEAFRALVLAALARIEAKLGGKDADEK